MPVTGYTTLAGVPTSSGAALSQIKIVGTGMGTFGLVRVVDVLAAHTLWTPTLITVTLPVRVLSPNNPSVGVISIIDLSTGAKNLTEMFGPDFTTLPTLPRMGDRVHYVAPQTTKTPYPGAHLLALVYSVAGSVIGAQVLARPTDGVFYSNGGKWQQNVPFDGDMSLGTWHWPE